MTRPSYKLEATVLQDGHTDPVTGPRCLVKMGEGPNIGRYLIAHTDNLLAEGTEVIFDTITRKATARIVNG